MSIFSFHGFSSAVTLPFHLDPTGCALFCFLSLFHARSFFFLGWMGVALCALGGHGRRWRRLPSNRALVGHPATAMLPIRESLNLGGNRGLSTGSESSRGPWLLLGQRNASRATWPPWRRLGLGAQYHGNRQHVKASMSVTCLGGDPVSPGERRLSVHGGIGVAPPPSPPPPSKLSD